MGEGGVDDVTAHPATRAMVDEYAAWYDRHFDPAWQDVVLTPPDARGGGRPWSYTCRRSAEDLRAHGPLLLGYDLPERRQHHPHAGIRQSHRAGHFDAVQQRNVSPEQIANAAALRAAYCRVPGASSRSAVGAATIGYRFREDPAERAALRIVRETDAGIVLQGKVGMHTSPAFAEDVYIGGSTAAWSTTALGRVSSCRSAPRGSRCSAANLSAPRRTPSSRR